MCVCVTVLKSVGSEGMGSGFVSSCPAYSVCVCVCVCKLIPKSYIMYSTMLQFVCWILHTVNTGCKLCPKTGAMSVCLLDVRACMCACVCVCVWFMCVAQFQILRKLSQDPVLTAMPSSVTPRQLTRLSWPARTPAGGTGINKRRRVAVKAFCSPNCAEHSDLVFIAALNLQHSLGRFVWRQISLNYSKCTQRDSQMQTRRSTNAHGTIQKYIQFTNARRTIHKYIPMDA